LIEFEEGKVEKPLKRTPYTPKPRLDERKPWKKTNSTTRSIANISLGNDSNDWKSVSNTAMVPHPIQPRPTQSEYETLEKTRSTVLDNPDLQLDPMMTVKQAGMYFFM
jgi:hypothetical protein